MDDNLKKATYFYGYNRYIFHGIGCNVYGDKIKIDWDFGYGDNWCGINPWLLAKYLSNAFGCEYKIFDGNKIDYKCKMEVLYKRMIKKFELYYFI